MWCISYICAKPACRSFGVVLWEMLTGEVPYKDVDSSAIIWGVGNNSLHLPVPESCPDSFKLLLRQCWWVWLEGDGRKKHGSVVFNLLNDLFPFFTGTVSRETGLPFDRFSCTWTSLQQTSFRPRKKHTFKLRQASLTIALFIIIITDIISSSSSSSNSSIQWPYFQKHRHYNVRWKGDKVGYLTWSQHVVVRCCCWCRSLCSLSHPCVDFQSRGVPFLSLHHKSEKEGVCCCR